MANGAGLDVKLRPLSGARSAGALAQAQGFTRKLVHYDSSAEGCGTTRLYGLLTE